MVEKFFDKNINQDNLDLLFKSDPDFFRIASSAIKKTEGEVIFFNDEAESYFQTNDTYYKGMPPIDGTYGGIKISEEEYNKKFLNASKKLYSNYLNTLSSGKPSVEGFRDYISKL